MIALHDNDWCNEIKDILSNLNAQHHWTLQKINNKDLRKIKQEMFHVSW